MYMVIRLIEMRCFVVVMFMVMMVECRLGVWRIVLKRVCWMVVY